MKKTKYTSYFKFDIKICWIRIVFFLFFVLIISVVYVLNTVLFIYYIFLSNVNFVIIRCILFLIFACILGFPILFLTYHKLKNFINICYVGNILISDRKIYYIKNRKLISKDILELKSIFLPKLLMKKSTVIKACSTEGVFWNKWDESDYIFLLFDDSTKLMIPSCIHQSEKIINFFLDKLTNSQYPILLSRPTSHGPLSLVDDLYFAYYKICVGCNSTVDSKN